jgi:uncharacterized protein YbjT (DUF2867 family)
MKVVVIGGTGLIGTRVVKLLRQAGHEVVAASPSTGINTITGEGLPDAMDGTDIVIDLANSPSFEEKAVMEFFQTAGHNLLTAEVNAGVKHHLAVSIVGVDIMQDLPYMRAKKVQEDLIRQSGIPYTIIRSTQFFEFLGPITDQATVGKEVHLSDVEFQPIAADDVASFVFDYAVGTPVNGAVEIAGPARLPMHEIVSKYLSNFGDSRTVVPNGNPTYFGGSVTHSALVPHGDVRLGKTDLKQWGKSQPAKS